MRDVCATTKAKRNLKAPTRSGRHRAIGDRNGKFKAAHLEKSRRPMQIQRQTYGNGCPLPLCGTGRYRVNDNSRISRKSTGKIACATPYELAFCLLLLR